MGSSPSDSQCPRVLLVHAFYMPSRKPEILVLDEATSHLEVERERLVNDAVHAMDVTRISIAHPPETIRRAGRLILLAYGCVHESDPDASAPPNSNRAKTGI
ncbi:hypothetical protein BBJ41_29030 [Burkholderia stabilis]|uniref:hypothetical protein n=1 Tax=Burkholderia stabilis TaxID=95485 RepID=UPI0008520C5E|nr:hypothetical protein [Burkholderia stabilis]AOR71508.1 hypothetical protein BBJ41_29030 [Burkholderia stabilis]HDR9490364.1 hypothetical protein [Burkholderia stabilis]HDR9521451.1 hypothetical protein [Burkholderia stabilis]HDR9531965.1 hypothetical protein [Burkholderia stabilis]HDR9537469.1 hypothetical protein [Burkholderia stabilis]